MKKKLLKKIRSVANDLPDVAYESFQKARVFPKDDYGNTIQTESAKLRVVSMMKRKVNHTRRLKKMVEQHGFDKGVRLYKAKILKIQKESK